MNHAAPIFQRTFWWSRVEAYLYQTMLLAHQLALSSFFGMEAYGRIGTLFSLIYLVATISDLGFENAAGATWQQWSQSRASFRIFFGSQVVVSAALCVVSVFFCSWYSFFAEGTAFILLFVTLEVMRRMCKRILQYALHAKLPALVELSFVGVYYLLFWGRYALGFPINAHIAVRLLCLTTCCMVLPLALAVYLWHLTLPATPVSSPFSPWRSLSLRCINALCGSMSLLFSSNLLVPLFAFTHGYTYAGTLKLLMSFTIAIATLMRKAFAVPALVTLAHADTHEIVGSFALIMAHAPRALLMAAGFAAVYQALTHATTIATAPLSLYACLPACLLLAVAESMAIPYEKFLVVTRRTPTLITWHVGISLLSALCTFLFAYSWPVIWLITLGTIRLTSISLVHRLTQDR